MIEQIKHQDRHARDAHRYLQQVLASLASAEADDLHDIQIRARRVSDELASAIAWRTRLIVEERDR